MGKHVLNRNFWSKNSPTGTFTVIYTVLLQQWMGKRVLNRNFWRLLNLCHQYYYSVNWGCSSFHLRVLFHSSPKLSCSLYLLSHWLCVITSVISSQNKYHTSAEPILPICRIRKLRRAPETPGAPLLSKRFSFSFAGQLVMKLGSGYENMNDQLF